MRVFSSRSRAWGLEWRTTTNGSATATFALPHCTSTSSRPAQPSSGSTTTTTTMISLVYLLLFHHHGVMATVARNPFGRSSSSSSGNRSSRGSTAFLWLPQQQHRLLSTTSSSRRHHPHEYWPTPAHMLTQRRHYATAGSSSSSFDEDLPANTGTFGAQVPFASLGLSPWLVSALNAAGKPISTHIQALSLPSILEGNDVVIGSETGAGKTLAYLLPVLDLAHRAAPARTEAQIREMEYYMERKAALKGGAAGWEGDNRLTPLAEDFPWETPFAIVLVPNRQLSEQVLQMGREVLTQQKGEGEREGRPRIDALAGSVEEWPFHPKTRPAPDVLVCTPATLSFFDRDIGLFSRVGMVVVDEADMLLEGDYGRHLDRILVAFKR